MKKTKKQEGFNNFIFFIVLLVGVISITLLGGKLIIGLIGWVSDINHAIEQFHEKEEYRIEIIQY